jgi:hypothetical protein
MSQCDEHDLSNLIIAFITGGGVVGANDYLVQPQGSPNNTVIVKKGRAYVPTSDGTMVYSSYLDTDNSSPGVTIAANATGSTQIDSVVLYVDLSASVDALADNVMKFGDARGTGGVAPTDTQIRTGNGGTWAGIGVSNPYIILANISVVNGFTSISTGNITDKRSFAKISGGDTTFQGTFGNFIQTGFVIPTSGSLTTSCPGGTMYFSGKQVVVAADGGHAYTASQDTYVDVVNTGSYIYQGVSNGAAAPAITANSIRIAKVVTSGSAVTSVTQEGIDSLSNLLYPQVPVNSMRLRMVTITDEWDNGTQKGTFNIDWSKGDRQRITCDHTGNLTLTYSNAKRGQVLQLDIDEDATGGSTITLPASIWPNGAAGAFTTTAAAKNSLVIKYDSAGTYRTQLAGGFA